MSYILSGEKNSILKAIVIGVISSVVIIAVLMCILSAVMLFSKSIPTEYLSYITIAVCGIGVLFGAYIAARICKKQGLLIGVSVAFIVFLAILIAGFSVEGSSLSVLTVIKGVVMLVMGALAGIKGVNTKEKLHIV